MAAPAAVVRTFLGAQTAIPHRWRPNWPEYIKLDILMAIKPLRFFGDSLKCICAFPAHAKQDVGYQLDRVQRGLEPNDFRPMPSIGKGVEEIRVWGETGTFRIVYMARRIDAVYVLHAFQKKTQATSRRDMQIAQTRLRQLPGVQQ